LSFCHFFFSSLPAIYCQAQALGPKLMSSRQRRALRSKIPGAAKAVKCPFSGTSRPSISGTWERCSDLPLEPMEVWCITIIRSGHCITNNDSNSLRRLPHVPPFPLLCAWSWASSALTNQLVPNGCYLMHKSNNAVLLCTEFQIDTCSKTNTGTVKLVR
jgi:hypothetical protein